MKIKVGEKRGFIVTLTHHKPKTKRGKERIWVNIRQNGEKKWRMSEALAYVYGADVLYVKNSN